MKSMDHLSTDEMQEHKSDGHGGHSWMMMACCVPMIVIALALVLTGVVSPSLLIYAVVCLVMMAAMMKMMDHSGMKM